MNQLGPRVDTAQASQPTVSVIVTNHNYRDFVGDCLLSIVSQTTQPMECIIVDDNSCDDSLEVIHSFLEDHRPPFRTELVSRQINGGQMASMMDGLLRVAGDFVVFVDSDDVLFPDFISTHLDAHLNLKYPAALSCSNEAIIDSTSAVLASTIEKWKHPNESQIVSERIGAFVAVAENEWRDVWDFGPTTAMVGSGDLVFVGPNENIVLEFLWSTTSGVMFRKSALDIVARESVADVRVNADFYLMHFSHLIGGSLLIQSPHGFYRRHGSNNFASAPIVGRGARAGTFEEDWDRSELLNRIEDAVLNSLDEFERLLGRPRLLQILAIITPARRSPRIALAIGRTRPGAVVHYFGLLAVRAVKRIVRRVAQVWRFA